MNLKIGMEILEIIQPGIHSSIQDVGRFGQRSYAIPQSGCLDSRAQHLANYLVGNSADEAVIEIIGGRFECKFLSDTILGIVGSEVKVSVNGEPQLMDETIYIQQNDILRIASSGLAYLAISGGIEGVSHFGSISTYPLAKLGGLNGDLLKKGDRLSATSSPTNKPKHFPEHVRPKTLKNQLIRIFKGPEFVQLLMKTSDFEERSWGISSQSNRMGIRLKGAILKAHKKEISPVPTFPGTIQLTNEGLPIVLMNDAQTTGGYPRLGQVIKADIPRLARMILGGSIRFKFVDISEARYMLNQNKTFLNHALK